MRPVPWHRLRPILALLLGVLVSTAPGAMMLSAASASTPAAAHHHAPPNTPHRHDLPTDCCCGLCSANCLECGGIISCEPFALRKTEAVRNLEHAGRSTRIVDTSSWHRLPPPIGPPS